jgi:hypothetical protein
MNKWVILSLASAISAVSTQAVSAPGEYWEITSKMEMVGLPMVMPATTMKLCIAKGLERDPRHATSSKDCEMTDIKISGNKSTWKFRCNHSGEIMSGEGEMTGTQDNSDIKMRMKGKSGGQDVDMTVSSLSKRIGGNCDSDERANKMKAQASKSK